MGSEMCIRDRDTIPTLLFFRDGKPVDSIVGYGNVGYSELMEFVNKNNVK